MSLTQPSTDSRWSDPPSWFACARHAEGPGVTRVTASGELDIATAPQLAEVLSEAARGSVAVILDLSELTFIDSSGLHAILSAHIRFHEAGCRLVLIGACRQVQRVFEVTGTEQALEFASAADAVLTT